MFTNLVIANKRTKMRGADRRAAIVSSATQLFARRGFRGVTTKELANAAGVSEPVLYEHFKDKSELYSAIIDAKSQHVATLLGEWFEPYKDSDDDRGFFLSLARLILDFHSQDEDYMRLTLFSALEDHPFARLSFDRHAKPFYRQIAKYIKRRVEAAGFCPWSIKAGLQHVAPPYQLLAEMATLRVHLDDVGPGNAPLLIAPGSHRLGRIAEPDIDSAVQSCGTLACLALAGDIWVYATPILHASEAAVSPTRRRVLQIDYCARDLPAGLEWLGV